MRMKKYLLLLIISVCSLIIFSCATTVKVQVERPAQLNLGTAKSIAIEPIKPSPYSTGNKGVDDRRVIQYLESNLATRLKQGGYYTVIDASDRVTPADIYLNGEIAVFDVLDERKENRKKNPNYVPVDKNASSGTASKSGIRESEYIKEVKYTRTVRFVYNYSFIDAKTNRVIADSSFDRSHTSASYDSKSELPTPYELLLSDLNSILSSIERDVKPYYVNKSLTLLKDKSKNPDFKKADSMADDGMIRESGELFYNVYQETGMFEAGYNAALIFEALGEYRQAEAIMQDLYNATADSRALSALKDIQNEIKQYEKLIEQNKQRNK